MKRPADQKAFNRTLWSALAIPLLLVVVLFVGFFWQLTSILSVNQYIFHTDAVTNQARLVRNYMLAMENGLRGYLLTNDKTFLAPYNRGEPLIKPEIEKLLDLVADNATQVQRINQLKTSYLRWHEYAQDVVARQSQNEVIPVEIHRTGFNYIESSRLVLVDFFETEDNLRNERVANSERTVQTVIFIGTLGVILLGLLLAILTRQQLRQVSRIYGVALEQVQQKAIALEHTLIDNKRLLDEEAKARQLAEDANAMKIYFLGMVSHELRTPLASIKGFATTLLAEDVEWDATSQREFITIISDEADRLTDLIGQLLDLSRLQAGRLRIDPKPVKLTSILNQAAAQFISLTANHPLRIAPMEALPLVSADAGRIVQVLVNLVNNAVKYAPNGSPIAIRATELSSRMVEICVEDQGRGISPEEREIIFEAFRQSESNKGAKADKGAGLGLAICKGILEMHGGKIWVEDARPGARFCFTLPIVPKLEVQNTALLATA